MSNMVEVETVHMAKDVSKLLTEEMALLGLTGKVSRAEFLGVFLSDSLMSIRAAREAVKRMAEAAPPKVEIVDGSYVGQRTPARG